MGGYELKYNADMELKLLQIKIIKHELTLIWLSNWYVLEFS